MRKSLAVARVVILEMVRRKDVYVLLFLTALVTLLLGSVNIFGDDRIARYLKEVCLTLVWLSSIVIATVTSARQLPAERENRTVFPLLAKPVSRWEVLFGKFLGCWGACALSLAVFYAFFIVLSGSREGVWPLAAYTQAYWLHCLFCAVVVAMTLLGSVLFSAVSANVTIMTVAIAFILLLGRHLHKIAVQAGGVARRVLEVAYFALPHLEWFDIRDFVVHNWEPLAASTVALDTLYAALYSGVLLGFAWLRFRRMPLN